jgi:hypothetical protein
MEQYERFYRWSAALPIAIPLVLASLVWSVSALGQRPIDVGELPLVWQWVVGASIYLTFSLAIGGIPYFVFSIAVFFAIRGRSARHYLWASLLAPALFAVFLVLCVFGFVAISEPERFSWRDLGGVSYLGFHAAGLGFVYVAAVQLLKWAWPALSGPNSSAA